MHALVEAGADVIELGVPFSDPMADGPTIQRASERALKHGMSACAMCWTWWPNSARSNAATPVVLMGYGNPIEAMGWETFAKRCAEVGVDGVLTVDFPPEESHEAFAHLRRSMASTRSSCWRRPPTMRVSSGSPNWRAAMCIMCR